MEFIRSVFTVVRSDGKLLKAENAIVLRSMIGKLLHDSSCFAPERKCDSCSFSSNCFYSLLFETPRSCISEDLRIKGVHPFRVYINSGKIFLVTFDGKDKTHEILSNIIEESGKTGLILNKNRVFFRLEDQKTENGQWAFGSSETYNGRILVSFNTPVRFKVHNEFTSDFRTEELFNCFLRRAKEIEGRYGQPILETIFFKVPLAFSILEKNLYWVDWSHYSSRQKSAMQLGGLVGSLLLEGEFIPEAMSLLEFNQLCGIGKNTIFGLGESKFYKIV